jgi:hypothetical protein
MWKLGLELRGIGSGRPARVAASTCGEEQLNPDAGEEPNVLATRIPTNRRLWSKNRHAVGV